MSLGLAESRILPAAPVDTGPRTPSLSFCTVQLRTLCAVHSLTTLCFSTTSGLGPGGFPGFWGSMVFRHDLILRKGSGKQQQQHVKDQINNHFQVAFSQKSQATRNMERF